MHDRAALKAIAEKLRSERGRSMSVRDLLDVFGAQRRGSEVVREIRRALRLAGLRSEPEFTTVHIDASIRLSPRVNDSTSGPSNAAEKSDAETVTRTIGTLRAASSLNAVSAGDEIRVATTKMRLLPASELVVLNGPKAPRGIVSWATIGAALHAGGEVKRVSDCTKEVPIVRRDRPLLETIDIIARDGAVLVQDRDKTVVGLVTARDISEEFTALARPFVLLGEIEMHVRRLCRRLPLPTLRSARDPRDARPVSEVHHLSLGEMVRLLENPKTWRALELKDDQPQVLKLLHAVRDIRNDVMHFEPDPPTTDDLAMLEAAERFLRAL